MDNILHITIVSGSPRQNSNSVNLARYLKKYFTPFDNTMVRLLDVREWNLPVFDRVFSNVEDAPDDLKPLADLFFATNVFVIVSPEYNGTYPASIQNLFDHFPRQKHKVYGIVAASNGSLGGMRCSQQLLLYVSALFGIPSPYLLITPNVDQKFNQNGELLDLDFLKNVETFATELMWLANKLRK